MSKFDLIVTSERGLLEWLATTLGGSVSEDGRFLLIKDERIPVMSCVTADDVRARHVLGVIPLSLAFYAASVTEVEMSTGGAHFGTPLKVITYRGRSHVRTG